MRTAQLVAFLAFCVHCQPHCPSSYLPRRQHGELPAGQHRNGIAIFHHHACNTQQSSSCYSCWANVQNVNLDKLAAQIHIVDLLAACGSVLPAATDALLGHVHDAVQQAMRDRHGSERIVVVADDLSTLAMLVGDSSRAMLDITRRLLHLVSS